MSPRDLGYLVGRLRRAVHERRAAPGVEPVDIGALVAPLRYDIVVRARMFDVLGQHAHLDGPDLVAVVRDTAYATWFEHVECARYFPELLHDEPGRERRFAARVAGAARLLRSFEEAGFDPASPITLIQAPTGSVSESGAPALGDLHIGDGCHRVALLLRDGATLEPWMYKVRPSLNPLVDNTRLLLRAGALSEADYVRHLAMVLPVGEATTVQGALAAVRAVDTAQADALTAILTAQGHLAGG